MATRFGHDDENDRFHDQRPSAHAKFAFQIHCRCAGTQCHNVAEAGKGPGSATPCALCARYQAEVKHILFLMCISTDH